MNKDKHVPDWMLERYLLGELPRKQRRQMEQRLRQDPALGTELERLRASDRQILSTYPADRVIPEILKRAALAKPQPVPRRSWRLAWLGAPALALALLMLVILPPVLQRRLAVSGNPQPGEYTAIKGDPLSPAAPALQIYRRSAGSGQVLRQGETARAGDLLQVAYVAGSAAHGVVLSIDGSGSVVLHFPEKENGDTALRRGRRVFLPQAYELDQAPRFERFFFVTAREPLPTAAILEKAGALAADPERAMTGPLDLPAGFGQCSLLVRK